MAAALREITSDIQRDVQEVLGKKQSPSTGNQNDVHGANGANGANGTNGSSKTNGSIEAKMFPPPAAPDALRQFNHSLFAAQMAQKSIFPRMTTSEGSRLKLPDGKLPGIAEGTYHSTRLAMAEMHQMIEKRFESFFDMANFEPTIPQGLSLDAQRLLYNWLEPGTATHSYPPDCTYPPCLSMIPLDDQTNLLAIFNAARLFDTGLLLRRVIPAHISDWIYGTPEANTMAGCEEQNQKLRAEDLNIGQELNVADRPDWYTDAVFAQQSFTGPNPTTIAVAPAEWVSRFVDAAKAQKNDDMYKLLSSAEADSLFIQDYSYFRSAVGAAADAELTSQDGKRFGCAAVSLFQLNSDGRLHPLSIVLDYKGSMEKSVVVFNQRLRESDSNKTEHDDWAWRYAKVCSQVSDWTRHEVEVHLTHCHFVEEATIVAAYRSFPPEHVVFRLLKPHWLKTLSLNAAARSSLVPNIVTQINGFSEKQTYAFIMNAYKTFDWTANYIPNDLKARGFSEATLQQDKRFHNYAYAKNMSLMWPVLYEFVSSVLAIFYQSDDDVRRDAQIASWCSEMQSPSGGQMPSFPSIQTLDELAKAVVMCIHIASPLHNSVNYLQCYYQAFVPSKPASLMARLPQTLQELQTYREADMMNALPVKDADSTVWLMSSQLPYLLSYRVAEDQTLLNYAQSLKVLANQNLAEGKEWADVAKAADQFYDNLNDLGRKFQENSQVMDKDIVGYHVMNPDELAVSVLI